MDINQLKLYAITDCARYEGDALLAATEEILANGATMLQLRDKHRNGEALLAEARALKDLCAKYHVPLIINDDVELALAIDADGVHVGQEDAACVAARAALGPDKIVGVSAQTMAQAQAAKADGADYLGCGAIFPSVSKDAAVLDRQLLFQIIDEAGLPVVAIGGIAEDNITTLAGSRAAGVALISALYTDQPGLATKRLLRKVDTTLFGGRAIDIGLFDCDGTLFQTRHVVSGLAADYLMHVGKMPGVDLKAILKGKSMPEAAGYVKHNYSVADGVGDIIHDWQSGLLYHYRGDVKVKEAAVEVLRTLRQKGGKAVMYTEQDDDLMRDLLLYSGMQAELDDYVCGWEEGYENGHPALFAKARACVADETDDVWAFDDTIEGIRGAQAAGYRAGAVYDMDSSDAEWKQMVLEADAAFYSFVDLWRWLQA